MGRFPISGGTGIRRSEIFAEPYEILDLQISVRPGPVSITNVSAVTDDRSGLEGRTSATPKSSSILGGPENSHSVIAKKRRLCAFLWVHKFVSGPLACAFSRRYRDTGSQHTASRRRQSAEAEAFSVRGLI